jgi:hypothetical protein
MIVGRGTLCVSDIARAVAFYGLLGSRPLLRHAAIAIVELQAGTHIVLFQAKGPHRGGPVRGFDLRVRDAFDCRAALVEQGVDVGPLREDAQARPEFEMTDPDGHVLRVVSSDRVA